MGGFLKWWVSPTTIGFPTKNDHFGVFWWYHHLRKHPYVPISVLANGTAQWLVTFKPSRARSCWLHGRPFWFLAPALTRRSHLFWGCCCSMALVGGSPKRSLRSWHPPESIISFWCWACQFQIYALMSCCCVYEFIVGGIHKDVLPSSFKQEPSSWEVGEPSLEAWTLGLLWWWVLQ